MNGEISCCVLWLVSNFEFAGFAVRKINDFEMCRRIAVRSPCCIIQRHPVLMYDGSVPCTAHFTSRTCAVVCWKLGALLQDSCIRHRGMGSPCCCPLSPLQDCLQVSGWVWSNLCSKTDHHHFDFVDLYLMRKVNMGRIKEALVWEAKSCLGSLNIYDLQELGPS